MKAKTMASTESMKAKTMASTEGMKVKAMARVEGMKVEGMARVEAMAAGEVEGTAEDKLSKELGNSLYRHVPTCLLNEEHDPETAAPFVLDGHSASGPGVGTFFLTCLSSPFALFLHYADGARA
jgi:hypothetical protein